MYSVVAVNAGASGYSTCVVGKYAPALSSACVLAQAGFYVDANAAASQTPCAAGSYSDKLGAKACVLCEVGKYQSASGQTTCNACITSSSSSIGATSCPDLSAQGAATVAGLNSMFLGGNTPFFVIFAFVIVFVVLAIVILRLRDHEEGIVQLKFLSVVFNAAIQGSSLVSEMFLISALLGGTRWAFLGKLLLASRLLTIPFAGYKLLRMFGPKQYTHHYLGLMDHVHFLEVMSAMSR